MSLTAGHCRFVWCVGGMNNCIEASRQYIFMWMEGQEVVIVD